MFQFKILQKYLGSKYCLTIGSINIKESDHEKVLGTTIDKHLDFYLFIFSVYANSFKIKLVISPFSKISVFYLITLLVQSLVSI